MDDDRQINEVIGLYDAPAYVRRARQVQEAHDGLIARCRNQREEWIGMTRTRLGLLAALAGSWSRLGPLLRGEDQLALLRELHDTLRPRLRAPVEATSSQRQIDRALRELRESIERFNRRWQAFALTVDFTHINELREGYNRYYVLEKECAVRSPSVARLGFIRLEPMSAAELLHVLPLLPVPQLARTKFA